MTEESVDVSVENTENVKEQTGLSYSSEVLLENCEQRYAHHKVYKTPRDPDCEDSTEAFDIGKTFHYVLETTKHVRTEGIWNILDEALDKYNTNEHAILIKAMLLRYLDLHEASGLSCVVCEMGIIDETMVGYIDAVMMDSAGYWYITDLKTSGRWSESILSRLAKDHQLNLYAGYYETIAGVHGLDPRKFRGCLYRVTTKSTIVQKSGESDGAYLDRLLKSVRSYEVFIPLEVMDIKGVRERHLENYKRSMELRAGEVPKRNYSYCENYFKPCPFWSNCHGEIFTKCSSKVVLRDSESYNRRNEILEAL